MNRGVLTLLVSVLVTGHALSNDWPHWRGPNYDGSAVADGLPAKFGPLEGVLWKAAMPGPAASTPIVHGDRVFLSSLDGDDLIAMAFDAESGDQIWRRVAGSGYQPGEQAGTKTSLHPRSNYASPSPVTDGKTVYFFYGNGDLCAYTRDGEPLWSRNLQKDYGDFCFQWTFSASPTLWNGLLYLQILQRDQPVRNIGKQGAKSFLLALDPTSGETKAKHDRPSSARMESLESYATPIPLEADGRRELIIVGGDVITGHDPDSLEEQWRWGTWNAGHREQWWRLVPSPVIGGGVALVCAPKNAPVYAVKLGGSGVLTTESAVVWQSEGRPNHVTSDVPTPLYYEGSFYVLSDLKSSISKVDPEDGNVVWTMPLSKDYRWRASPTGADGKIYLMDHHGTVVVLDADSGETLHQVQMGSEDDDQTRSSIVVAHDCLYIRTNATLYCIGDK